MTLMRTCLALGEGIGADVILTFTLRPERLRTCFIVVMFGAWLKILVVGSFRIRRYDIRSTD